MSRRRLGQGFALLFVAALSTACDEQTATVPAVKSASAAGLALAESKVQAFDLTISSSGTGEKPMIRVLHVVRLRTDKGWRATIAIDPTSVDGAAPVRNEIARLDVDEDGNRSFTTNTGRMVNSNRSKSTIVKDGSKFTIATEESSAQVTPKRAAFDLLDAILFAKSESSARLARLERLHGALRAPRGGRLQYSRQTPRGTAEFDYDAGSGLPLRSKGPDHNGGTLEIDHAYREAGGILIRTSTTHRFVVGKSVHQTTHTISHITIDGREIIQ